MKRVIDGKLLKNLIVNGCQNLNEHKEEVDNLNVFPVPDGDTGSNMHMTIDGGARALSSSSETEVGPLVKEMSRAMTMSARGNSGVILSQFFKGFATFLENEKEVTVQDFANAFLAGVKQAYQVVKKPVEGTILTVMRESSQVAFNSIEDNSTLEEYFKALIKEARESLERTPDLLDVLKEAEVIDSGGAGFVYIIEGMSMALSGHVLEYLSTASQQAGSLPVKIHTNFNADSELEFGYCTEFILQLQNSKVNPKEFDLQIINDYLESIDNSVVSFKDDDIIKVHVHTFTPGNVLTEMQKYGEFVTIKVENMSVQNSDLKDPAFKQKPKKTKKHLKYAVVAVSSGDGITEEFIRYGANEIVKGGQTMNPSTESFIEAFKNLDAENIFVFPNNSNIIMAANQAAETYTDAKVYVINSKTIAECYTALTMLDYSSDDPEAIRDYFEEQIATVVSGQVTYSTRDTNLNGIEIKTGDYISIMNHEIVADSKDKVEAVLKLLEKVDDIDYRETLMIIYGQDVTEEELNNLLNAVQEKYPYMEVGTINGKQDIYSFIVAL